MEKYIVSQNFMEYWIYKQVGENKKIRIAVCPTKNVAEEIVFILNKWEESKDVPPKDLWQKKDFN